MITMPSEVLPAIIHTTNKQPPLTPSVSQILLGYNNEVSLALITLANHPVSFTSILEE